MPDTQWPDDPSTVRTTPPGALERRRDLLGILREAGGSLALADLAADLCVGRGDVPASPADAADVQRCATRIYHQDVPKLADAGVVAFDPDRRIVTLEA